MTTSPFDEGRTLTLCVEVTNTGTTNLDDIEIRDHSLDIDPDVIEDDSLPGFVDTLTGSLGALAYVGSILILIVAALLPFIWVPFVLWAVARWLTRRQDARRAAAMPPPPQGPRDDAA